MVWYRDKLIYLIRSHRRDKVPSNLTVFFLVSEKMIPSICGFQHVWVLRNLPRIPMRLPNNFHVFKISWSLNFAAIPIQELLVVSDQALFSIIFLVLLADLSEQINLLLFRSDEDVSDEQQVWRRHVQDHADNQRRRGIQQNDLFHGKCVLSSIPQLLLCLWRQLCRRSSGAPC